MTTSRIRKLLLPGLLALALAPSVLAQISVFVGGLNNPRGLKWGPDGNLYLAEGGKGGTSTTLGLCDQAPFPVGPYSGGYNSRILKISSDGSSVTAVAENLPSSQTGATLGSFVSGVADVAFLGHSLYAIEAGAGCSHGLFGTDNGVLRVHHDGTTTMVANLSNFQKSHPVANPEPDDFEPDGTWYSMIAVHGTLYAIEPNHGELVAISHEGEIRRIADISRVEGHIVPTAVVFDGHDFLVGNLDTFPIKDGSSKIMRITPGGELTVKYIGFSDILGLAFDAKGRLYVLENTTGNPLPTPYAAKIVRVDGPNNYTVIADSSTKQLSLPTAMAFGPDGALYVSNWGFGPPPVGMGEILRIVVPQ